MTDRIDFDEALEMAKRTLAFNHTMFGDQADAMEKIILVLKQAKEDSEKFDVLEAIRQKEDLQHRQGPVYKYVPELEHHYVNGDGHLKALDASDIIYGDLQPYKVYDQLIDGQLYMVNWNSTPHHWPLQWEDTGCWSSSTGDEYPAGMYQPQTDDQGRPIMCGPVERED